MPFPFVARRPVRRAVARFSALRIRQKIGLLPLVAGAGFAAVLAVAAGLGVATQSRLAQLERERYPALETGRRLGDLLEATQGGRRQIALASGEERRFLEDGDEVVLRARARRDGFAPIGFGECRGSVLPASPAG